MTTAEVEPQSGFRRTVGTLSATGINMTQMCGIGPFITIPVMIATMGGPQAILGWIVGALLAVTDGLVWAELGAAMPGAGGTYLYLREAFQYRSGKLMPFLFAWTALISIPLIMSTGAIGIVQYLTFLFPHLTSLEQHLIGIGIVVVVVVLLFRRIESIRFITTALWIVMLVTVVTVIAACYSHFSGTQAFTYPPGAFHLNGTFFSGLGAGLLIAVYDYLGYNTTAYMGDELKDPGRTMPRSIVYSIGAIMVIYLILNIGVVGVVHWQQIATKDTDASRSVASVAVTTNWGHTAAEVVTWLIVITAFASVFCGLLGGSRVPFNAARDKVFLAPFGRLSRRGGYPWFSLLVMGVITAIASLFSLTTVINMLIAVAVLVQSVAQIVALTVLRKRQPTLNRPYKQWLYPVPSVIALVGWLYVYKSSGLTPVLLSLAWIAGGCVVFLGWARVNHSWPFAPPVVREVFLEEQAAGQDAQIAHAPAAPA